MNYEFEIYLKRPVELLWNIISVYCSILISIYKHTIATNTCVHAHSIHIFRTYFHSSTTTPKYCVKYHQNFKQEKKTHVWLCVQTRYGKPVLFIINSHIPRKIGMFLCVEVCDVFFIQICFGGGGGGGGMCVYEYKCIINLFIVYMYIHKDAIHSKEAGACTFTCVCINTSVFWLYYFKSFVLCVCYFFVCSLVDFIKLINFFLSVCFSLFLFLYTHIQTRTDKIINNRTKIK